MSEHTVGKVRKLAADVAMLRAEEEEEKKVKSRQSNICVHFNSYTLCSGTR